MSAEGFTPIKANNEYGYGYESVKDFDAHYDETDHKGVEALLLGHAVAKVSSDHLRLDDGTILKLVGHEGGCACSAGCYDLTVLNSVENVITKVEFEDEPGGDGTPCPTCSKDYCYDEPGHLGSGQGAYRIFIFAGDQRINLATFEGTDGNGYYGTGYSILVRRGGAS